MKVFSRKSFAGGNDKRDKVTLQILIWVFTAAVATYVFVMLFVLSHHEAGPAVEGGGAKFVEGHNYDMEGLLMESFPSKPRRVVANAKKEDESEKEVEQALKEARLFAQESLLLKREVRNSLRGSAKLLDVE